MAGYIDKIADYWTAHGEKFESGILRSLEEGNQDEWLETVLQGVCENESLDVLDVGCGPGFFPVILGREGHRVTGIDYTEHMVELAKKNCDQYGSDARILRMDAQNLEFDDESFDIVVSRDVLWNLDDPAWAYSEWMRVLRPGGHIVMFDGNYYLYAHDDAYKDMNVERHIQLYHKNEDEKCRDRLFYMANIAEKLPASMFRRPQWDVCTLIELGASSVTAFCDKEDSVITEENGREIHLPFHFHVIAYK